MPQKPSPVKRSLDSWQILGRSPVGLYCRSCWPQPPCPSLASPCGLGHIVASQVRGAWVASGGSTALRETEALADQRGRAGSGRTSHPVSPEPLVQREVPELGAQEGMLLKPAAAPHQSGPDRPAPRLLHRGSGPGEPQKVPVLQPVKKVTKLEYPETSKKSAAASHPTCLGLGGLPWWD